MTKFNIPESIIKTAKKRGKQLSNLINTPLPEKYEVGQIWSTFQSLTLGDKEFYTDEPKLTVIIDVQQDASPLVTTAPISTETHFASEYDLIISSQNSPIGFTFMVEVWNETPVYEKHLKNYLGNLSENEVNVLTQIYSLQLFNDFVPETLSSWVGIKIFGEQDPRLEFQEKEILAISYLAEAATFSVSLSLSNAKESMSTSDTSKVVFRIKPIFELLSNFEPLMSKDLAFAASEQENETFILASPDKGKKFVFELQEELPPKKEIFLFVHFITRNYENKKCSAKFYSEKSEFEFPSFILKKGLEVKANVGSGFNVQDVIDVEIEVG